MKRIISSNRQFVPSENRKPGQQFEVQRLEPSDYRLVRRPTQPNEGSRLPGKDFFVPIRSECTDKL